VKKKKYRVELYYEVDLPSGEELSDLISDWVDATSQDETDKVAYWNDPGTLAIDFAFACDPDALIDLIGVPSVLHDRIQQMVTIRKEEVHRSE